MHDNEKNKCNKFRKFEFSAFVKTDNNLSKNIQLQLNFSSYNEDDKHNEW